MHHKIFPCDTAKVTQSNISYIAGTAQKQSNTVEQGEWGTKFNST